MSRSVFSQDEVLQILGTTRILGIIGNPVKHSVSPAMHNAAFAALNLDLVYLPFPTPPQALATVLKALQAINALGVNVTVPYKQAVLPLLDEIDPHAQRIGAVNTILFKNDKIIGYNTDGWGFTTALEKELDFDCAGKRIVILGAGGSAYSVADRCLELKAAHLVIANRTLARAESLAAHLTKHFSQSVVSCQLEDPDLEQFLQNADLVINTTSVGLRAADQAPIPVPWLVAGRVAADLIYNPRETAFLKIARQQGLTTINGQGMLLYQGALAFEIWTGVAPPVAVMKKAVEKLLC